MSESNTATGSPPAVVAAKEQEASDQEEEGVQMKHGKRNRDTEQKEDGMNHVSHAANANAAGGGNNAACEDDEPEDARQPQGEQKQGENADSEEEINEAEDDSVPLPSNAAITTTDVEPSLKEFMALIRKENPSVSWVGNYTTAHETKIEIGFLKKEAMALTTLMSYYQVDGEGATSCPVAMISGPASFGRKLAIFYSSLQTTNDRYYYWQRDKREKVNIGLRFKMENQKLRTLAKLGRADFYIGTVNDFLEKGLKKKVVLQVTEQCRLKMNTHRVRSLGGRANFAEEMNDFVTEVFQSGQLDIVNLLITHIEFDADVLLALITKAINQGNSPLTKFLLEKEPSLLNAPGSLIKLVSTAIVSKSLALVKMLVVDFSCDVNVELEGNNNHFLHMAVTGQSSHNYMHNYSGSLEVVEFLLDQGAKVDAAKKNGQTPLLLAIQCRQPEMVRLLISRYPENTILDLVAECGKGLGWGKERHVAWLKEAGILKPPNSDEDQVEAAAATAGGPGAAVPTGA